LDQSASDPSAAAVMAAEAAVMVVGATLAAAAEVIGAGSTVCGLGALIRMAISAQVGPIAQQHW